VVVPNLDLQLLLADDVLLGPVGVVLLDDLRLGNDPLEFSDGRGGEEHCKGREKSQSTFGCWYNPRPSLEEEDEEELSQKLDEDTVRRSSTYSLVG
jgi:hypothetical protein